MYMYIPTYTVYIYISLYIYREREMPTDRYIQHVIDIMYMCTYDMCIYIYIERERDRHMDRSMDKESNPLKSRFLVRGLAALPRRRITYQEFPP